MEFNQITTDLTDHVLTITLNRPGRLNAWTQTMFGELLEAFDRADADDEVRAVIVTGAGRAFCAGADLERGGETFTKREHEDPDSFPRDSGGRLTLRIFDLTKPVIAAINGAAVGIGATMTLPMDVRIAADDTRIGFVFVRRGSCPRRARAGSCPAWWGSAGPWSGSPPAVCSTPARRSRAAWSAASTRRASCSTPPGPSPARSPRTPRRCTGDLAMLSYSFVYVLLQQQRGCRDVTVVNFVAHVESLRDQRLKRYAADFREGCIECGVQRGCHPRQTIEDLLIIGTEAQDFPEPFIQVTE